MKILIINQHVTDVIGGSELQCDLLATHLTRLGHDVVYFAVNGRQRAYDRPYTVAAGPLKGSVLRRIALEHRPDLVYWRFNKRKFLPSVLVLKRMGLKVVFAISHINDTLKWSHKVRFDAVGIANRVKTRYFWFRQAFASRVNHLGYRFVDGVVAQLHQQTGRLAVPREQVISNCVDDAMIPFRWDRPFVVWVANLKPMKNPEMFIELARRFQATPIDFLMVGKIQHVRYRALLDDSTLPPNFHYLGPKPIAEVNGILQHALFLVHTCQPEGFPNVFIQAWKQGKPTLSLYYDPDQMIQDHHLGYVSGNFEQFTKDAQVLIDNVRLKDEIGQRAKVYADEHFLPEKNAQQLEAFFREVLEDDSTL